MRRRRTVCFITLKVREVATYISRTPARARSTTREEGERGRKNQETDSSITEKGLPPPESENERFREWWMTRAGSLANCEQAKCSSGFAALGWRRCEWENQPCDPTVENGRPCTSDRVRYIYIYLYIYIWELGGASEFDRSSDVSKMNVPIIDVEMFVTMFGRDPLNVSRLVAVDRWGRWLLGLTGVPTTRFD